MNQKKKKVLLLAVSRPGAIGGQAVCAHMLMDNLHEVEWISISFPLPGQNGIFRFLASIKILVQSLWICSTQKIDAVQVLSACAKMALLEKLIIARILKWTGAKVIFSFHGAFDVYYNSFSNSDRRLVLRLLRKMDIVLCLHADLEKFLVANGIVPAEKIHVIPNGVSIEPGITRGKSNEERAKLLYLGWVLREKGMHTLVDAIGILVNQYGDKKFSLDIVGPEPEKGLIKELMNKAESRGISPWVNFLPPVFGDEKRKVYAGSGIFVFPTRMEGFPFVLLEAMQSGLAVVVTDISPLNLVVQHNSNGMLFKKDDPADLAKQLHALLNDGGAVIQLGQQARQHVISNYGLERIISMYRDFYAVI